MERRIDGLVNQIYEEGVQRARQEADEVRQAARREAAELRATAEREREELLKRTQDECAQLRGNVEAELRLIAEQAVAQLRARVRDLLVARLAEGLSRDVLLDVDFVRDVVREIAAAWNSAPGDRTVELLLPAARQSDWAQRLESTLAREVDGLQLQFSERIASGFVIRNKGQSFQLDFSDDALAEFFRSLLKPKTNELLFG